MREYSVYWIHTKDHSDPYSQGYIGITSRDPTKRLKEHRKSRSKISSAIKAHQDISVTVLYQQLTEEEAKQIEYSFRMSDKIGWNLTAGGGIPPSNKGKTRPQQSEFMKKYNPTKQQDVREKISKSLTGRVGTFAGKKRPYHSKLLKLKRGEKYPKFRGYFVTPWGTFSSYSDAIRTCEYSITIASLYNYCIHHNMKKVSAQSLCKSNLLKSMGDIKGKTYRDLGFDFIRQENG